MRSPISQICAKCSNDDAVKNSNREFSTPKLSELNCNFYYNPQDPITKLIDFYTPGEAKINPQLCMVFTQRIQLKNITIPVK